MKKKKFTGEKVYHVVQIHPDGHDADVMTYSSKKDRDEAYRKIVEMTAERLSIKMAIPDSVSNGSNVTFGTGDRIIAADGVCKRRGRPRASLPYIAVNLDGELTVDVFTDRRTAKKVFNEIRDKYKDSGTFEESSWGFSVDQDEGPSVALGNAQIIGKNSRWEVS